MCYTNKKRMKITRGFRVPERARKKKETSGGGENGGKLPERNVEERVTVTLPGKTKMDRQRQKRGREKETDVD